MPCPLFHQSFRSVLPFRIYKAPPPLKPHLLPLNIHKKLSSQSLATPPKLQPMVACHDAVHQPIIEWDLPEEAG